MAYIGIIMLVGIAVNDSIVLVDAVLQIRRGGPRPGMRFSKPASEGFARSS